MYVVKYYMEKYLQGDIATCAATWLHVWSINGEELASVNTCVGRADRMQQILCVAFSQTHEWDSQNVIMTGSTDGVARVRYNLNLSKNILAKCNLYLSIFGLRDNLFTDVVNGLRASACGGREA